MSWQTGAGISVVTGVAGPCFSGALQLTTGASSLEGLLNRPMYADEEYLVTGYVRSISGVSTGYAGYQTLNTSGGMSSTTLAISIDAAAGWQPYAGLLSPAPDTTFGRPELVCTTGAGLQFANVQFPLSSGTHKIANGAISSTVSATTIGSIPSSGGLNLTGGAGGSAYYLIGTATIIAKDPDGTAIAGDFDVFFEMEMFFNQGMGFDVYLCLDYTFALGSLPNVNDFKARHGNVNTSPFDYSYTIEGTLSGLSAGSHTVTVYLKPAINTSGNKVIDPTLKIMQLAK